MPQHVLMLLALPIHRDRQGNVMDVTPGPESGLYVRTRVHEYGGGDYLVTKGAAFFSNFK